MKKEQSGDTIRTQVKCVRFEKKKQKKKNKKKKQTNDCSGYLIMGN